MMSSNKKFTQTRSVDFEITNIVSVDIDALRLRLYQIPDKFIQDKVEEAWTHYLSGCSEDYCELCDIVTEVFSVAGVKAVMIPDSMIVKSVESCDDQEDDI